jgi:hypothetical protein
VELALAFTDNLEESNEVFPDTRDITGAGVFPRISLRLSLILFLFISVVTPIGGRGAGRIGINFLAVPSSRRACSLAAAVTRSTVATLAKGNATEGSELIMTGFDITRLRAPTSTGCFDRPKMDRFQSFLVKWLVLSLMT